MTDIATPVEDEAVVLLKDVVSRLSTPEGDIGSALRTCLHVCNMLGWQAADWFSQEIDGYQDASKAPPHRHVVAQETWRADTTHGIIDQVVTQFHSAKREESKQIPWVLTGGIDDLLAYAEKGVIVRAGETEERWSDTSKEALDGRMSTIVDASQGQRCVRNLRNSVFNWASQSYAALQLGDAATDIWHQYRAEVDEFLGQMNLAGHVSAITEGLASSEPQRWREAMWSSRDLLHDVAERLWKDPRKTYKHLPDEDGSPIEVTSNKFVNRLMAYMHQKGITGTLGGVLRAEWARLRGLNSLASSGHEEGAVTHEDARLAFFGIYMLLGELVLRTDCQPVEEYK